MSDDKVGVDVFDEQHVYLGTSKVIRLSKYVPLNQYDDGGYSALHRPGSWEWQLDEAEEARQRLFELGYTYDKDPDAEWRVRWRKA